MIRPRTVEPLVYGLLAGAVAGPLLKPGLVLAVDLVPVPHPHLGSDYWGLASGTHAGPVDRLPIDLLFVALGHVGAVAIGEKLLLLAIVFLAGLGMHRLVPATHATGRYFAGALYAVNPFVYDRLYTGQWYLLLGYALLPWAFAAFLPLVSGRWRSAWRFAVLAALVGVASPHMFALLGALTLATALAALVRGRHRAATAGAVALGGALTLLASAYWLLPTPGVRDFWNHVGSAQLQLYRTVSDPTWGVEGAVAGLYGYWNDADPIKAHLAAWPLVAAALVLLAAWGLAVRRREPTTWGVAAAALFGFVLALGTSGPLTGSLFHDVLDHVAVARSFREPQKGVALLVFGYAYLGGLAAADLRANVHTAWRRAGAAVVVASLIALPLLGGYRELGGLWGSMRTSAYPSSWSQARSLLRREAGDSRTLVLPWHGYMAYTFADERVVASPAAAYFDVPTLASRSVGEGLASADNSDPVERYVASLVARGATMHDLGACLAPLGISHVLLTKDADWGRYSFLARQSDLVVERSWSDLVLYRNVHPTSLAMAVQRLGSSPCTTTVVPLKATSADPAHIRLASAPRPGTLVALAASPGFGWSLGRARSVPRDGALNVVRAETSARTISLGAWSPLERNYALGLLGLVLVAASWLPFRRRQSPAPAGATHVVSPRERPLWVVLPTYDEAANIRRMVAALLDVFAREGLDGHVLVVDDDSPDGTGAIADELAAAHAAVDVLHRHAKNGLGRAYLDGFHTALGRGAGLVAQMDCDFSHDPGDVPRLVDAVADADLALGSRYVAGGGVENWSVFRRALSRGGCAYARLVLGIRVRDLTGGFKCFRAEALERLELDTVQANGYGFQIETTYRAGRLGLAVAELPIVFRDRTAGTSKMSWRIAAEALLLVVRLRAQAARATRAAADLRSSSSVASATSRQASDSALVD